MIFCCIFAVHSHYYMLFMKKTTDFPHNGKLLQDYLKLHCPSQSKLAREINVETATIKSYCKSNSIQSRVWWKLGAALNHNFFADMAQLFPVDFATPRETELLNKIEELNREVERLNIAISVYKEVTHRVSR